jgi:hypothetical protein
MIIIGADYHPGFQQIGFVDTDTGEFQERRLQHREEAEKFYRDLAASPPELIHGVIETWLFPFAKSKHMHRRSRS